MKTIKINRLLLENFKCHRNLELNFNGVNASIYGDNATGKTSVYDALTWLLFGKDSLGNGEKSIDIKPLNADGEVADHDAITSVEAEFLIDGEVIRFKRTFREVWSTKRGSSEAVYSGNASDYFVDDVPMKKNLFDAKIQDLIPEDVFRMLTSVSHFANDMKWQTRRSILFDMAGTLSDREIMEKDPRFMPLVEGMGKLDLPDYKTKITHERKGLMGVRDDIPARISEQQNMLQVAQAIDVSVCQAEEASLHNVIEELTAHAIALDNNSALEQKRLDLRAAKMDRDALERANQDFRRSQDDGSGKRRELEGMLRLARSKLDATNSYIERANKTQARLEANLQDLRQKWVTVNGEAFAGGICPTCGQSLPFEQLKAKTAEFEVQKQERLHALEEQASANNSESAEVSESLKQLEESRLREEEEIRQLETQLDAHISNDKPVEDMAGYAEKAAAFNQQIRELQEQITQMTAGTADTKNQILAKKREASDRLAEVQTMLARASMQEQIKARIQELKDSARATSEKLERIEQMLYLMEEFVRYKASFVEANINDLFRIATFRLFREQANGGLEERCDVVHDGVPYMGLNNGMRINIGIDVINTLSRYYGVTVPLFVDNAEGVTKLEQCDAQVIRLVVSEEDKELRIE